jgi:prepilin-type N-terminal cleavage/methylation domain-containing protein
MRHAQTRHAFTLVELLVAISIIGTLMSLLLPAVQNARESGRRITCTNNLGQLSKAFISYDGQHRVLPGWRNTHPAMRSGLRSSNPAFATVLDANTPSWPISLMPFLERLDIQKAWESVTQSQPVPTEAPAMISFVCPTSPADSKSVAQLAYSVNAGSCVVNSPTLTPRRQFRADGIFLDAVGNPPPGGSGTTTYLPARTNLDAISGGDGVGNTLLVAEKSSSRITQGSWNAMVPLMSVSMNGTANQPIATFNSTSSTAVPVFGLLSTVPAAAQKILNSVEGAPSSNHPGGVVVAFGDGQTRFMRDTISPHVYAQLVTSDSEWDATSSTYIGNSSFVGGASQSWLKLGPAPYTLSSSDYD